MSQIGFGGLIKAVAQAYGLGKPMSVPTWMIGVMPYFHRMATMSLRVSTEKARGELGWAPVYRTVADGLRAQAG